MLKFYWTVSQFVYSENRYILQILLPLYNTFINKLLLNRFVILCDDLSDKVNKLVSAKLSSPNPSIFLKKPHYIRFLQTKHNLTSHWNDSINKFSVIGELLRNCYHVRKASDLNKKLIRVTVWSKSVTSPQVKI